VAVKADADDLTSIQQRQLISNINYLQYSTAKIRISENKAIAEDIYYSIINELKIEYINNRDLNFQYGEFLEKCKNLKLTQNEKDFIKYLNEKQQKKAYLSAFSNFGSVFVPGQSPFQMVASLVYTSVSNAVAVANRKNQLDMQLERDMFYLDQKIVSDIFDMQTTLFTTSAKLLAGKSSEGRINENSMNMFMKAISLPTSREKMNALCEQQLQQNFSLFPPYWYELGNAYQEIGDHYNALMCYDNFMSLKNTDIILKDKNYVKLIKNRIRIILGDDPSHVIDNATNYKQEILGYIDLLKANYLDSESGEKNMYLAKIYYLIGEVETSLQCLDYIIGSKTIYPELIEEAVAFKMLILASQDGGKAEMYQSAYNFGMIKFGNEHVDYSQYNVRPGLLERIYNWICRLFSNKGYDNIPDDNVGIRKDWICFEIPQAIRGNYEITFDIEGKLYVPLFKDSGRSGSAMGFLNVDYDDVEDGIIKMHLQSIDSPLHYTVKYAMQEVPDKVYEAADKAYKRLGSDISAHNAQTAVEYGEIMAGYDYEVEDEIELAEEIRDDKEDWGKNNNKTADEIASEISKTLSDKLSPDLKYLKERLSAVESAHYKQKEGILYSPEIISYNGDYFLSGIISIYDSSKGESYMMDANGDMTFLAENTSDDFNAGLDDMHKAALSGDLNSMIVLGFMFIEGNNVEPDPTAGIRWLLFAVNNAGETVGDDVKINIARACKCLGDCYNDGTGVKKDKTQAKKWYNKAQGYGFKIKN
jgi:TPR repeat protein